MGNMSGSYGSHYTLWQSITQNSQDIANNKSNVTVRMYLSFDGSSYYAYTNSLTSGSMTINGTTYNYSISSINFSSGQAKDILLATWTGDIVHNTDGTKALSVSGSWNTDTSRIGSGSCSASKTLSTIPRASTITCSTANIGSKPVITITSANSSFTHNIYAYFGSLSAITVATGIKGGTINTWTIPDSFYSQIPSNKIGEGTMTCDTYSNGTKIGSNSVKFYVTTNESVCRPTVSATIKDTNSTTTALTGNSSKLVKYKSTAQLVITSTVKNSATIKSVTVNGVNAGTSSSITLNYSNVSTASFTIVTTDSRGYTNTSYVVTPSYVNYVPLTVNANFFRPQPTTGEVQLTYSGNYFYASFGAVANELLIIWEYRVQGASAWTTGGTITPTLSGNTIASKTISLGTDFDYQTAYEFQLVAVDKLTTITVNKQVSVGMPVFHWGKNFLSVNGDLRISNEITKNSRIAKLHRGFISSAYIQSFNNALTTGIYDIDGSATDGPVVGWGCLDVQVANGDTWDKSTNWIWQTFYQTSNGGVYQRSATNAESFTPWQQIYRATTLYDNSSGTTGTISNLSESVANFTYLEIYFAENSIKVYNPNGKTVGLHGMDSGGETLYIYTSRATISGTTITQDNNRRVLFASGGTAVFDTTSGLKGITKVVGYR